MTANTAGLSYEKNDGPNFLIFCSYKKYLVYLPIRFDLPVKLSKIASREKKNRSHPENNFQFRLLSTLKFPLQSPVSFNQIFTLQLFVWWYIWNILSPPHLFQCQKCPRIGLSASFGVINDRSAGKRKDTMEKYA